MRILLLAAFAFLAGLSISLGKEKAGAQVWLLTLLEQDGEELAIPSEKEILIVIDGQGSVTGTTGVNRFSSQFERKGNSLEWTEAFKLTRRAGSPEMMNFERAFLKALRNSNMIEQQGEVLTFKSGQDAKAARLRFRMR